MSLRAGLQTDPRPWGSYTVLDDDGTHKVNRFVVVPGRRLSSPRHAGRCVRLEDDFGRSDP
jgi:mannose-6-phosphate isomerase-like protein (cupin superfamily)